MATSKADNKAMQKANQTALKSFPKSKIRKEFEAMAALASAGDQAAEERAKAALNVCKLACSFRHANSEAHLETVLEGWRDNLKLVTMELAVAGNRFAELIEGKDGAAASAKLTGYGNNVASIAKGVLEFEHDPTNADSYREVRKAIEGLRAEARRETNPEQAAIADAKELADTAWTELRGLVFGTNDSDSILSLASMLAEQVTEVKEQLKQQAELDKAATTTIETVETPTVVAEAA